MPEPGGRGTALARRRGVVGDIRVIARGRASSVGRLVGLGTLR